MENPEGSKPSIGYEKGTPRAMIMLDIALAAIMIIGMLYIGTNLKCCADKETTCVYELENRTIIFNGAKAVNMTGMEINGTKATLRLNKSG